VGGGAALLAAAAEMIHEERLDEAQSLAARAQAAQAA